MKKLIYHGLIMLGIVTLTFSACKKNEQISDDEDITSVEESAQADEVFSDTFTDISSLSTESIVSFSTSQNQVSSSTTATLSTTCAIITVSPQGNVWPKTVTFDFGTGCTLNDITRKGKIIAVFTDRFQNTGAKITVTFDNYYVNDTKIEGEKIITNNGRNTAGNYTFTLNVAKSRISSTRGIFTCNSTKVFEWIKGDDTVLGFDDQFSITGTATGTNSKGKNFSLTITKPVIKKIECRFLVSGTIEIKTGDRPARVLDYGNGDCDAKATVTVNGVTKTISLRK